MALAHRPSPFSCFVAQGEKAFPTRCSAVELSMKVEQKILNMGLRKRDQRKRLKRSRWWPLLDFWQAFAIREQRQMRSHFDKVRDAARVRQYTERWFRFSNSLPDKIRYIQNTGCRSPSAEVCGKCELIEQIILAY